MQHHIDNKIYHIEILPPKQDSQKLEADLQTFADKFNKVMENGYCACIPDNAMGHLYFQAVEVIEELGLEIRPEQVMIHLNAFHTKQDLHNILDTCQSWGVKYLLVVSGDGSERLPRLKPEDIGAEGEVKAVTSVELLRYIEKQYPGVFTMGVAFNPYEPHDFEFDKLARKLKAGAKFIITQPIIEKNAIVDELLEKYPDVPVIIQAWMSRKLHLMAEAVGHEIPENTEYDPIENLKMLIKTYPKCGFYLTILGFKTQFPLIGKLWT